MLPGRTASGHQLRPIGILCTEPRGLGSPLVVKQAFCPDATCPVGLAGCIRRELPLGRGEVVERDGAVFVQQRHP
jgi:hypothetical protein